MATRVAESQRLALEPLSIEQHLEGFHALNSDERVSRWSHRPPTQDLEAAKKLIVIRFPSAEKPFIENYAIILKNSNGNGNEAGEESKESEMIGVIGIPRLSHDGLAGEVGYGIMPSFWGKGYASEALGLFVRYYFNSKREFQKEYLVAETEPENTASERVLEKAGFIRGEFVRDAFEVVDYLTGEKSMRAAFSWKFDPPPVKKV
ncbi:acyl-CoA N-acyltransferase [Stipitochalara longipes BDJ]|nr:acyl-CoA N-acyltransferase [Stipitochalara longipes BDJ]